MMSTESMLTEWRNGQAQAERLVAGLLYVEGYKRVDPQLPLGGPDGTKDILFVNEGRKWIAAAYFPTRRVSVAKIKNKFKNDLAGLEKNAAHGIAFFVNQHLTPAERKSLLEMAAPAVADIFHVERIRAMLDSPRGCGLRLEYLRIAMTEEEQWSFWQEMNSKVMETLVENDTHIRRLHEKVDLLLKRTQSLEFGPVEEASSFGMRDALLGGQAGALTVEMLMWIHRLVTDSTKMPDTLRGRIRSIQVWIGGAGASLRDAKYVPPPPDQIADKLSALLADWRQVYPSLVGGSRQKVLFELAKFHHAFLSLHPFADANGRVARAVIDQAAHELLGMRFGVEVGEDSAAYYSALESADTGDLRPLITALSASLSR